MASYAKADDSSTPHHDHATKPAAQCNACTQRFGTNVTTAASISRMLSAMEKEVEYAEAGSLIQIAWILNKQLDRIATALEKGEK